MSERLWAPWRIGFLTAEKPPGCFLCSYAGQEVGVEHHILERGQHGLVCLNLYPYTGGHLLVAPYRHVSELAQLESHELADCMAMVSSWTVTLKASLCPDGFNIGLNQGKAAGAAVEDHIHFHVVPRWNGDHNFMTVVSDMRVIHQGLDDVYNQLRATREGQV